MKEIDVLLEKYANGELTAEEQDELNRLTHRDKVLSAAGTQAHQLKRKQWTRVSVLASLLIVASIGTTLYLRPAATTEENAPVVAQAVVKQESKTAEVAPMDIPVEPQTTPHKQMVAKAETPAPHAAEAVVAVEQAAVEPIQAMSEVPVHIETESVVACNTQCSPDSVISDIWKFLKA